MNVHGSYDARSGNPSGSNALAIIFRIVVPIVLHLVAVVITRLWPTSIIRHVNKSEPFDSVPTGFKVVDNPLSSARFGAALKPGPPPPRDASSGSSGASSTIHTAGYVSTALVDPMAPPPWQQQGQQQPRNPPWLQQADPASGLHLQHEVWRQMMLAQQAQLSQQQQLQQGMQGQMLSPQKQPFVVPAVPAAQLQQQGYAPWLGPQSRHFSPTLGGPQTSLRFDDRTMSFGDYPVAPLQPPVAATSPRIPAYQQMQQQGQGAMPSGQQAPAVVFSGQQKEQGGTPRVRARLNSSNSDTNSSPRIPAHLEQQQQQPQAAASMTARETLVTSFGDSPFNASSTLGRQRQRMR